MRALKSYISKPLMLKVQTKLLKIICSCIYHEALYILAIRSTSEKWKRSLHYLWAVQNTDMLWKKQTMGLTAHVPTLNPIKQDSSVLSTSKERLSIMHAAGNGCKSWMNIPELSATRQTIYEDTLWSLDISFRSFEDIWVYHASSIVQISELNSDVIKTLSAFEIFHNPKSWHYLWSLKRSLTVTLKLSS